MSIETFFLKINDSPEAKKFYSQYKLGQIWERNQRHLIKKISSAENFWAVFKEILRNHADYGYHEHGVYDSVRQEYINQYLDSFNDRYGPNALESVADGTTFEFSQDGFPQTYKIGKTSVSASSIRYLAWEKDMLESIGHDLHCFCEIGGGYGGWTRHLKLRFPEGTFIILDLPFTCVIAHKYLEVSMPGVSVNLIQEAGAEIVKGAINIVPTCFIQGTRFPDIDFLFNAHSFGEMDNETMLFFKRQIEQNLRPKYLFQINRFLNCFVGNDEIRKNHSLGSIWMNNQWSVLDFEFDPWFSRLECIEAREKRVLKLIIKMNSERNQQAEKIDLKDLEARVESSDYFDTTRMERIYLPSARLNGPHVIDGSIRGVLFSLWELARMSNNQDYWFERLLQYLKIMRENFREDIAFEEEVSFKSINSKISGFGRL